MTGDRPAGGVLDPIAYTLTAEGARAFTGMGAEPPRNPAVRCCVDWTEQRHHMAGAAGRELLSRMLDLGWVKPSRYHRALSITDSGREQLAERFGILPDELSAPRAA